MTPELMRVMRPRNGVLSNLECKRLFRMDAVSLGIRLIGILSALALLFYMIYGISHEHETQMLRHRRPFIFRDRLSPCTTSNPCVFKIVADLDKNSRIHNENTNSDIEFKSFLFTGKLFESSPRKYQVSWDDQPIQIQGKLNEGGRGMELSELIIFNNALLSFDDRTGVVYELTKDNKMVPRHIITEGDGFSTKGMKIEWATVKDDLLYIGSFGKEFTTPNGSHVLHENNFWVSTIDKDGNIQYNDWKGAYTLVRKAVGANFPGYTIHEAVNWNPSLKSWVFLPRRISSERYDEVNDESKGSNLMIIVDENLKSATVRQVGEKIPTRGFSSFKFVPGTNYELFAALKSEEHCDVSSPENACDQRTFITVMDMNGEVMMEETEVPSKYKYEGIVFVG